MQKQTNNQPAQTITFELPNGVTSRDVLNVLRIASKEAHAQRMAINSLDDEAWRLAQEKQNYLSHLFNTANRLSDQAHDIAWEEPNAAQEYRKTENLFEH